MISAGGGWGGESGDLHWYTAPNGGGTAVGAGNPLEVEPTSTTTYYPRWEDSDGCTGCCVSADGPPVTITVLAPPENPMSLTYTYDKLRRVTTIDRTIDSTTQNLVTYTYDGDRMVTRSTRTEYSDRASVTGAPEVHIDYMNAYDDHGRITSISNVARTSSTAQNLAAFGYTYDNAGNRLTHVGAIPTSPNFVGHAKARQVGYTYDSLHRVTQASYTAPSSPTTAFNYDLLGKGEDKGSGVFVLPSLCLGGPVVRRG